MKHSPEIDKILSNKTSSYYKVGVLCVSVLLIVLLPCILLLIKERDNITAIQIRFHLETSKDSLEFFSPEGRLISKYISSDQFSHMYIFCRNSDWENKKDASISIVLEKDGKTFIGNKLCSKDIAIRCEFTCHKKEESTFFYRGKSITLKNNKYTVPLLVSDVKIISDTESTITAYLDLNFCGDSKFIYVPSCIPSEEVMNNN